jgi:hypothetical protein
MVCMFWGGVVIGRDFTLGGRMQSANILGKDVFVRELLPQDLKLEIEALSVDEAKDVAEFLARVVGRAHNRQMSGPERKKWLAEIKRNRTKSLDAPSWLWNSVVDLVGIHEAAYLQHCRRYALSPPSTEAGHQTPRSNYPAIFRTCANGRHARFPRQGIARPPGAVGPSSWLPAAGLGWRIEGQGGAPPKQKAPHGLVGSPHDLSKTDAVDGS